MAVFVGGCAGDPLLGTWSSAGGTGEATAVTFHGNGAVDDVDTVDYAASDPNLPDCHRVASCLDVGTFTESNAMGSNTATFVQTHPHAPCGMVTLTGCAKRANNSSAPFTLSDMVRVGAWIYVIDGDQLTMTLAGSSSISFTATRQ